MNSNFSQKIKDILGQSREEAIYFGSDYIYLEHIFIGLLKDKECIATEALTAMNVDSDDFINYLKEKINSYPTVKIRKNRIPLHKSVEKILKYIHIETKILKHLRIDTGHLLLSILKSDNNTVSEYLKEKKVTYSKIKRILINTYTPKASSDYLGGEDESHDMGGGFSGGSHQSQQTNKDTPALDNFGINISKAAEEETLDPIIGRGIEIERIAQILSRRKKNNPILIGEPGVGKSAIAEGLAMKIYEKKVSRVLFDKRIYALDLASIVAGTKYRGQFEERMKAIIKELTNNKNIILFIDEIHTIVGAGGATGSLDAANMLKPALARGEIQCIGATTLDEYRKNIEKDGALERRFQKVIVEPTSIDETKEILNNIKGRYESHHNVTYTDDAITACVRLTDRYISDRFLPDKAIDALDEAGSRVHIKNIKVPKIINDIESRLDEIKKHKIESVRAQNYELAARYRDKEKSTIEKLEEEKVKWENDLLKHRETVDEENISEVIAMMTGIPVKRIAQAEGFKLVQMKEIMARKIIGQDEAIGKIVKSIQRNRAGLKDPKKPIGSFIFLGPTGVGKTQLAKVLAEYLFDSKEALIRVDMSEYMEKFSVSRLVGAPPGYIGYEEGGQLTEKVRRKPYSVILLDEIEKAHPDVFNLLLQVFDEGFITDSLGRKIDFRNSIIIMTSNIGSRDLKNFNSAVGFSNPGKQNEESFSKSVIQKALKNAFAPEFINRLDDIVMFNTLTRENIHKIIDVELVDFYDRINNLGYKIEIKDLAKDFIAEKGFDQQFGARPLKRAIQKYLEDGIAEEIINSSINENDTIVVDVDKASEIKISINKFSEN